MVGARLRGRHWGDDGRTNRWEPANVRLRPSFWQEFWQEFEQDSGRAGADRPAWRTGSKQVQGMLTGDCSGA